MTSPHHLHATAATWSLGAALTTLHATAAIEARAIRAQVATAAEPLRSPSWGRRYALGGHGDPTGDAINATRSARARPNRYELLHADVQEQLLTVAHHLPHPEHINPLGRIRASIPGMQPGTAAGTTRLLDRLDERVRRILRLRPALERLPDVTCPACRRRLVYVQTAAPLDEQTVICGRGCRCTGVGLDGQGCACGTAYRVEGVAHIWLRSDVLGAVAGAAPTTTREDQP
ncbi:hypothetical protein AB0A95_30940 [Micromonospora sp. NPDC049230]|uniref:hypothetical protein n=1 Tax=Micromonospora sp. NPDC049230 TaxID=3155502 RepID=UPI0033DCC9AE